jgi:superoxide dismutase, Fe-Mn family
MKFNRLYIALSMSLIIGVSFLIYTMHQSKANNPQLYTVPALPYAYDALEPYIDARTMELHHDKHHQAYVDKLNDALKDYPELQQKPLEELLTHPDQIPEKIRTKVLNNGGGHYNHSFFWLVMSPDGGGDPTGIVKDLIIRDFASMENFKKQFSLAAKEQFGSGWAWLSLDPQGKLIVHSTANQDIPQMQGLMPLLCIDVWEHAYYLNYQNKRPDYIDAWWHVVNWKHVEENYTQALNAQ